MNDDELWVLATIVGIGALAYLLARLWLNEDPHDGCDDDFDDTAEHADDYLRSLR